MKTVKWANFVVTFVVIVLWTVSFFTQEWSVASIRVDRSHFKRAIWFGPLSYEHDDRYHDSLRRVIYSSVVDVTRTHGIPASVQVSHASVAALFCMLPAVPFILLVLFLLVRKRIPLVLIFLLFGMSGCLMLLAFVLHVTLRPTIGDYHANLDLPRDVSGSVEVTIEMGYSAYVALIASVLLIMCTVAGCYLSIVAKKKKKVRHLYDKVPDSIQFAIVDDGGHESDTEVGGVFSPPNEGAPV